MSLMESDAALMRHLSHQLTKRQPGRRVAAPREASGDRGLRNRRKGPNVGPNASEPKTLLFIFLSLCLDVFFTVLPSNPDSICFPPNMDSRRLTLPYTRWRRRFTEAVSLGAFQSVLQAPANVRQFTASQHSHHGRVFLYSITKGKANQKLGQGSPDRLKWLSVIFSWCWDLSKATEVWKGLPLALIGRACSCWSCRQGKRLPSHPGLGGVTHGTQESWRRTAVFPTQKMNSSRLVLPPKTIHQQKL